MSLKLSKTDVGRFFQWLEPGEGGTYRSQAVQMQLVNLESWSKACDSWFKCDRAVDVWNLESKNGVCE
jgi:hypothetical protein